MIVYLIYWGYYLTCAR